MLISSGLNGHPNGNGDKGQDQSKHCQEDYDGAPEHWIFDRSRAHQLRKDVGKNLTWIQWKSYFCSLSIGRNQLVQIVNTLHTLPLEIKLLFPTTFITEWFKIRFNHKGSFCKPNLVPLVDNNVIRFMEYKLKCLLMFDHSCFCFIDEKHLVNSDSVPKKLGCCPLSGKMNFILAVSGDFRETYNLITCISGNHLKERPILYIIRKQNGMAVAFISFCEMMVMRSGWLRHDEIIVLDNAAIYTCGDSSELEHFCGRHLRGWSTTTYSDGIIYNVEG
jgi:hypothetical protein